MTVDARRDGTIMSLVNWVTKFAIPGLMSGRTTSGTC